MYANPHEPHLCAHLSLARYMFNYSQLLLEGGTLFKGTNQYVRYSKMFMALIKDNMDEINTMGEGEGDLGNHSCSKGVVTMVA